MGWASGQQFYFTGRSGFGVLQQSGRRLGMRQIDMPGLLCPT